MDTTHMPELLPRGVNAAIRGLDVSIDLEAVDQTDTVSGTPHQGVAELGTIGQTEVGIWELRDGVVTDIETEEFFVVLSGSAKIEFLGEDDTVLDTVEVNAQDVMRLAAGTKTRWSVKDHIRKVYISE